MQRLAAFGAAAALQIACAAAPSLVLPGLQPDGFTRLHNQLLIRPAGEQVGLGDFPVNLAVDPTGRWAAALHAGYGVSEVRLVDLRSRAITAQVKLPETFCGLAFSADGGTLVCSGASDGVLHVFSVADGRLEARPDIFVSDKKLKGVVAGFALSPDGRSAIVALCFDNRVVRVDLAGGGGVLWTASVGGDPGTVRVSPPVNGVAPNDVLLSVRHLIETPNPLHVAWDRRRGRAYVSLWGESAVAVIGAEDGKLVALWPAGLHPNELLLAADGRLFVSNGGVNTVTVIDAASGKAIETLSSAMSADDLPGSTPDSLALAPDGRTLFVANAYNNTVAVFDVAERGSGRGLGFIPTGWFPTAVRLTPDGGTLLVVSARGTQALSNDTGNRDKFAGIAGLYRGSLGIVAVPSGAGLASALAAWTRTAQQCRPAPQAAAAGGPIPVSGGASSPIRHVVYIIKENRTYDQVLGDVSEGNGKASLCLFPEKITPNIHAIARQFVLLDNFYANAEVSASGHEWSMAGYSSEFVEKSWPLEYGHKHSNVPYPSEGRYLAAVPSLGYIWDRAAAAGVSYRDFGEFVINGDKEGDPVISNLPALRGHVDPLYHGWDLEYHDVKRAARFISELRRFDAAGDMPRLQVMRLPQDHTAGAKRDNWTPEAMVADNDLALGRVIEALSQTRFWPDTAVFVVEDDAQSGPDHVDAHRTVALVASPYTRHGAVDSTAYTTCSMLRTIELILGLSPMSQFDAGATPMTASFQANPDTAPYAARPAGVDIERKYDKKNVSPRLSAISARFDLSREDLVDEQTFNRVIWAAVRGENDPMPAPVHAAFIREIPHGPGRDADGDDDDR